MLECGRIVLQYYELGGAASTARMTLPGVGDRSDFLAVGGKSTSNKVEAENRGPELVACRLEDRRGFRGANGETGHTVGFVRFSRASRKG